MHGRRTIGFMFLMGLALWGCSGTQSPSNAVWTAQPVFLEVDNQLFRARIEPQKRESPYYTFFLLTLTNKSDADLIVDWNASEYLFNGSPQGVFVFEGLDPATLKTAQVPSETVAPGTVFSREIMPLRLIAWSPLSEKTSRSPRIRPGMLPAGENGIRLAVGHENGQMTIPLSMRIAREEAP